MFELPPPEDDGLIIPEVGEWSRDKHYFLRRYIDAFTTAMRKKRWESLHYIDLFAGAGIERLNDSGQLEWGSALIAAQSPCCFDGLHLCELDPGKREALQARVTKFRRDVLVLQGDANEKAYEIIPRIPRRTLSLAFLDPYGLHLYYETLRVLADRRADLIIFFPDHMDALRNWKAYYLENPDSNLDRVLGPNASWREIRDEQPKSRWAEALRKLYVEQIKKLGYKHFHYERIPTDGRRLYLLIFCSKHEAGEKIWRGISSSKPDGQRTLDFERSE